MQPTEQAAREILAQLEATYQPTHEYVRVDERAFGHLDLGFYRKNTERLSAKGFRVLADVEDRTITNAPATVLAPVLVRTLVSRDGTSTGIIYHPRLKSFLLRVLLWVFRRSPGKVVEFETECSDGTFVATSNAMVASAITSPPMIDAHFMPQRESVDALYAAHTARVAAHLAARPGVRALPIAHFEEMIASQNRMNAIKAAFRGELAGVTREELERLSLFGRSTAHDVHDAIRTEQMRRAG
jgi:hypothetical protein